MFKLKSKVLWALAVLLAAQISVLAQPQAEPEGTAGVAVPGKIIDPLKLPFEAPRWRGIKILKPLARDLRDRIERAVYFEDVPEANVIDQAEPSTTAARIQPLVPATNQLGFVSVEASGLEPPDPHLAVGPNDLIAATNGGLQVHSKTTGARIGGVLGLNGFFGVPAGYNIVSDPKVIYDAPSGRFFAVLIGYNSSTTTGSWFIAVSTTNSASGTYRTFRVDQARDLPDYPGWGICDDKVIVTSNNFNFSIASSPFTGAVAVVLNKAQLVAGGTVNTTRFADVRLSGGAQAFTIQPAHSLSATTTCHMVTRGATATTMQFYRVTGVPTSTTNATLTTGSSVTVASSSTPPSGAQSGSSTRISPGDTRLLDATFRNGALWTAHNTGCTFTGSSTTFSCARLLRFNNVAGTPTVAQDARYGLSGFYYYFPALRTDASDNMGVAFTRTGTSEQPNLRFGGLRAGSASFESTVVFATSGAAYTGTRWGDYFGAAFDSADGSIWFIGEYKRATTPLWSTFVVRTRF
ncbi:hypothetical protein [Anthocerotibacter panamensis]|uniref:hypothetical protein n=1 Tax=Anthocerotibacter panamensis TaxID=2857077 RepID=UPI001C40563F|nr:hypothetical protein [Anthocerotibacter panamensis]